jgi:prepilin-type N-terminal cleavage/methylation domain-containing protein
MNRRGVTLVELVIGIALGAVSALAIYSVLEYSGRQAVEITEFEDFEENMARATYALATTLQQAVNIEAPLGAGDICAGGCGTFCQARPPGQSVGYLFYPPEVCKPGAGELRAQTLPGAAAPTFGYDSALLDCANTGAAQNSGQVPPVFCVDALAMFNREASMALDKTSARSEFRRTGIFFQRPDRLRSGTLYIDRGQTPGDLAPDISDTTFTRIVRIRYEVEFEPKPHVIYLWQTPETIARVYTISVNGFACATTNAPVGMAVTAVMGDLITQTNANVNCSPLVTASSGVADSIILDFDGPAVPVTYSATLREWAYVPKRVKFSITGRKFKDISQRGAWNFDINPPAGTAAYSDVTKEVTVGFRNVKFGISPVDTSGASHERLHGNLYYFNFVAPKSLRFFDF